MLPLNEKKFIIEDFNTILGDWSIEDELQKLKNDLKHRKTINGQNLIYIMFDCIKRRQKLDEIISILSESFIDIIT